MNVAPKGAFVDISETSHSDISFIIKRLIPGREIAHLCISFFHVGLVIP